LQTQDSDAEKDVLFAKQEKQEEAPFKVEEPIDEKFPDIGNEFEDNPPDPRPNMYPNTSFFVPQFG